MTLPQELLIILFRVGTILPLLLTITLFMGKRAIGNLPVFDFLIIMTLASVTGADIADPKVHHIHTVVAILAITLLQRCSAYLMIKNRKIGKIMTFEPTIVVHNGKILSRNLKKIRYSVDNLLQMLREKDVFDVADVEVAIVEGNGTLSLHLKHEKANVTIEDLQLTKKSPGIAYPVILEGTIYSSVLNNLGLDLKWLHGELQKQGIQNVNNVFFASVNDKKELYISERSYSAEGPLFYH
ncbi:DUF421 domain-containing protein [Alteribacter populi]|uniref:DUF421 domain-containing protein n=1 Tax=Alteribacter populi TaxID=2011011 RepID=UPI000BBA4E13|nr:DUF421 domain-containing protein [Alteribacter populi]